MKHNIFKSYKVDFKRYNNHSRTKGNDTAAKLVGEIITIYHVIEKGLTMPDVRLGFGKERIIQLCELCRQYMATFDATNEQFQHAVQVILEYEKFHSDLNYELDDTLLNSISKVKELTDKLAACAQKTTTKQEFFKHQLGDFLSFSKTRASIRNYSDLEIPYEEICKVLELARNTPSSCNRQPCRVYVFSEKNQINQILEAQGGNRGFGHLASKLLLITSDLSVYNGEGERNLSFVDGGMYAMNLLYSLHYNKIAACILNTAFSREKEIEMRKLCNVKDSEVFVAMISCGYLPDRCKIANSNRYSFKSTTKFIK